MNIPLSPELERLIAEKLRSGRYQSADEVIREGLELLRGKDEAVRTETSKNSGTLADLFSAIAKDVPEEAWAQLPSDLSKNLDHYLYGSEKTS
jgi:antitoxin ParD1/3/4